MSSSNKLRPMSTSRPFSRRLFVPSKQPEGMRILEKTYHLKDSRCN